MDPAFFFALQTCRFTPVPWGSFNTSAPILPDSRETSPSKPHNPNNPSSPNSPDKKDETKTSVSLSLEEQKAREMKWNLAIDTYSRQNTDIRPLIEIEKANKISSKGEALFKTCSSNRCVCNLSNPTSPSSPSNPDFRIG